MSEAATLFGVLLCRKCRGSYNHVQHEQERFVTCQGCGVAWEKDDEFRAFEFSGKTFMKVFTKSKDLKSVAQIVRTAEEFATPDDTLIVAHDHGYAIDIPVESVATRLAFAAELTELVKTP